VLHRARLSAQQAVELLKKYRPTAPGWQVAEMFLVQAYVENLMAEHYCNGLVISDVVEGAEQYGSPMTTQAVFERALAHANEGLAAVTGTTASDVKVRSALQVTRGRILMNLNRPAEAAQAVAGVLTSFRYDMLHSQTTNSNAMWSFNNLAWRYSVSNAEGTNGLNFATANDPRVPVCVGGDAACRAAGVTRTTRDDQSQPLHIQLLWPARETPVAIASGIEARLIEAEAQLRAGNATASLATLNAARTTVSGLTPLTDAGTETARVSQLFRERAFWLFGRGHRVGALRRLIRQYNRTPTSVFPIGAWHKGGNYGADITVPVPQAEENNPSVTPGQTCLDRNA
jgi:starch-binding outer membrane protein, SusD/RagB family